MVYKQYVYWMFGYGIGNIGLHTVVKEWFVVKH